MCLYLSSTFMGVVPIKDSLDSATRASFCAAAASLSFLLAVWKQNERNNLTTLDTIYNKPNIDQTAYSYCNLLEKSSKEKGIHGYKTQENIYCNLFVCTKRLEKNHAFPVA